MIRSPGSRVITWLRRATTSAHEIISRLLPSACARRSRPATGRGSAGRAPRRVTSHGPTGPKPSKPLPLPHWPPLFSSCQVRSDTSLATQKPATWASAASAVTLRALAADHDAQLHLPVEAGKALRRHDVVVGAGEAARPFGKHHRLGGHRHAGLHRVVVVVEADRDELGRAVPGHPRARAALHLGQTDRVDGLEHRQRGGRQVLG